ncbi:hypothetical protein SEA_JOLENE_49 [Mycobacterium phage Jolene]|nr:hypothetical protein SEA_PERIODT_49 [Mycobacterium phage Periodt]QYW01353.1 hypothetical protein SEA_JOLENE_49 [Mycobacterium phage Jolene]WRQ08586.1 hypothetical protein JDBV13_01650 [Mycobacterium phage mckenna]
MTIQTPQPADARASAWIGAHERIVVAQKLKVDHKKRVVDPLPELYWATLAEAAVLAELARADQTTGLHAGGYLVDQQERIEEFGRLVARSREARRHPHRAAGDELVAEHQDQPLAGRRVMVTRGEWGGRFGQVYATHLDNDPPMLDVELDPPGRPDDPNEPVMICVPTADVALGRKR